MARTSHNYQRWACAAVAIATIAGTAALPTSATASVPATSPTASVPATSRELNGLIPALDQRAGRLCPRQTAREWSDSQHGYTDFSVLCQYQCGRTYRG
jgi:hypothetical protein